nr:MAG TPA: hypothetical protein [Caudoviricetes sp.]
MPFAAERCGVHFGRRGFRSTVVLKTVFFEPRNSKTVLFEAETCPRNSKTVLFVTFNVDFYLRNRKLPLRRCKLPPGKLRWRKVRVGRLPWRMALRNVAKDTPSGLDTGGWRLVEWRYNKGEERKETPMDIEIDFFEELGGYYTADLADILEDFEG